MESNDQTELTNRIETDSERAGWQLCSGWVKGVEGSGKKGKILMDMDNSMVIVGWGEV